MTMGDASGTVTICRGQGLFLRADDAGVLVRNFHFGRARRIAWTEISHFADGQYKKDGMTSWQLDIILHTGKRMPVLCSVLESTGDVVAAIQEAAQPHGIPADLAGVPATKHGRPAVRGLYEDPGGQAGLRYWDSRQWSPFLPSDVNKSGEVPGRGPGSWSALPTADGRWTYAATRATLCTVLVAVTAAVSAACLIGGLVIYTHLGIGFVLSACVFAVLFAGAARRFWMERKFFMKLDEAVKGAPDDWS